MLTALELSGSANEHLGELEVLLDEMYGHVADNLPGNAAVDIVDGKIRLDRLEAEPEPAGYKPVHDAVQAMLPRIDYPELLLEVHARTGMFDCFEHIGGKVARPEDLDLTLTALLVHKSTNIGLEPVIKPDSKALSRSRLAAADSGYFHLPGISAGSGSWWAARATSTSPPTGAADTSPPPTGCASPSPSDPYIPGRTGSTFRPVAERPGSTSSRTA